MCAQLVAGDAKKSLLRGLLFSGLMQGHTSRCREEQCFCRRTQDAGFLYEHDALRGGISISKLGQRGQQYIFHLFSGLSQPQKHGSDSYLHYTSFLIQIGRADLALKELYGHSAEESQKQDFYTRTFFAHQLQVARMEIQSREQTCFQKEQEGLLFRLQEGNKKMADAFSDLIADKIKLLEKLLQHSFQDANEFRKYSYRFCSKLLKLERSLLRAYHRFNCFQQSQMLCYFYQRATFQPQKSFRVLQSWQWRVTAGLAASELADCAEMGKSHCISISLGTNPGAIRWYSDHIPAYLGYTRAEFDLIKNLRNLIPGLPFAQHEKDILALCYGSSKHPPLHLGWVALAKSGFLKLLRVYPLPRCQQVDDFIIDLILEDDLTDSTAALAVNAHGEIIGATRQFLLQCQLDTKNTEASFLDAIIKSSLSAILPDWPANTRREPVQLALSLRKFK